jgi:hypothetical protein
MVNSAMLEAELKLIICSKHKGMLTNGVVLHHDNNRPHMAAATVKVV